MSEILIRLNLNNFNSLFSILILNAQADPDAIKNIAKDEILIFYKLSGDGDRILYFKGHMREEISKLFEYIFQLNRVDPYSKVYFNIGGILSGEIFKESPRLVKLIKEFQSISFYRAYYIEDTVSSGDAIEISPLGLYNLIHSPGRYPQQLLNSMAINLPFLYYVTGNEIYYNDFKMIIPGFISTLLIYLYKVYPASSMLHYLIWHDTLRHILNGLSSVRNCRYIVNKFDKFIDEYIRKFDIVKPQHKKDRDPREYLNYIKEVNITSYETASRLSREKLAIGINWRDMFKAINKILVGRLFNLEKDRRGRDDIIDVCESVYRFRGVFERYSRVIYPLIITEQATLPDILLFKDLLQNHTEVQTIIFPTTSTILNYLLLSELAKLVCRQEYERLLDNVYIISDDTWYTYNLFINVFKKSIENLAGKVAILIDKNLRIYGSGAQFTSLLLAVKKLSDDYRDKVDVVDSKGEKIL